MLRLYGGLAPWCQCLCEATNACGVTPVTAARAFAHALDSPVPPARVGSVPQMKLATVLLLAMCVIGAVYAEDVDVEDIADDVEAELDEEVVGAAHCILYKKISAENDRVVKDRNFTQEYTVYNVGAGPCFDVSVSESVPSAHFEIVEGAPEEFFEKIEAYVLCGCA